MDWTREQSRVLDHLAGFLLVVAVAGAGKTTLLLGFIKRLIEDRRVRPDDILMTTFSKRGASDMGRRAACMAVPAGVEYRTLHSYAFEMVRAAGHRRRIEVAKDWMLVKMVRNELRSMESDPDRPEELPKPGDVLSMIGIAKAALVWPDAWTTATGETVPGFADWLCAEHTFDPEDARVYDACYRAVEDTCAAPESHGFEQMVNKRLLTFDDMLAVPARAVLRGERRDRWVKPFAGKFKWVLVDEVQDNNRAQWVLVRHLAGERKNLVAVGDDQQSIFGFRGAMPRLMREFLDDGATLAPLSLNWRSGWRILDAANGILEGAQDRLYEGGLTPGRGREVAGSVDVTGYGSASLEAKAIVEDIAAAIEAGEDPDEIACLYRLNACSGPLEVELIRRGIAYRVAGQSFFSRPVIRAAIGYLGAALDPADERGWRFGSRRYGKSPFELCYASPLRGLSSAFKRQYSTVQEVRAAHRDELGRWRRGARELVEAVDGVQHRLNADGLAGALEYLFEDVGLREFYRDEAASDEDETETDASCKALLECAETLSSAQEMIEFALSMTGTEDHNGERGSRPLVTLSTVHKAKGLEWDRVYVVGMTEGLFPFRKGDQEEERRLAYVATTRPRKVLRVSWTHESNGQAGGPSIHAQEVEARVAAQANAAA